MENVKKCATCHKEFKKGKNISKKSWLSVRYCSRSCINIGRSSWNKGIPRTEKEKLHLSKVLLGSVVIQVEHTSKKVNDYHHLQNLKKVISLGLKEKNFFIMLEKKNNNWKGGVTSEHQKIRHSPEMKTLRNEVFKRDDYTCKNCGRKRKPKDRVILQIHHIKSFAIHKELRFDKNNIVTLCAECHRKTDTYGKNL